MDLINHTNKLLDDEFFPANRLDVKFCASVAKNEGLLIYNYNIINSEESGQSIQDIFLENVIQKNNNPTVPIGEDWHSAKNIIVNGWYWSNKESKRDPFWSGRK